MLICLFESTASCIIFSGLRRQILPLLNHLGPFRYISVFESIFFWVLSPAIVRGTDEFDEYETSKYGPCSFFLNVFSALEETLPDFN